MSDISLQVSFPLDSDGFLRRECPYCKEEFKINLPDTVKNALIQSFLDNYLSQDKLGKGMCDSDEGNDETEYHCPYCGQTATDEKWWTEEQMNYALIFAKNIANKLINEHLIKAMKNISNSFLKVEGKELDYQDPWISPEEDDLNLVYLPCCNEKIKLDRDKIKDSVFCFVCGFKHSNLHF